MKPILYWCALPAAVILLIALLLLTNSDLVIYDITPRRFAAGAELEIVGYGFGSVRGGSSVLIDGKPLTQNEYIDWSDERITIRSPHDLRNGRLAVAVGATTSNEVFITNETHITTYGATAQADEIQIHSHSPAVVTGGDIVTFHGVFSRYEQLQIAVAIAYGERRALVQYQLPAEDIIRRSLHAISVRLPSGISSGNITMQSGHRVSAPYFMPIDTRIGTMHYGAERRHSINYGAYIDGDPTAYYTVWLPIIPHAPAQHEQETLFMSGQFQYALENAGYFYIDQTTPMPASLRIAATVTRTEQQSRIDTARLTASPPIERYQLQHYLEPQPWLAVGSAEAASAVATFGAIPNLYLRARAIYNYILDRLTPAPGETAAIIPGTEPNGTAINEEHIQRLLAALTPTTVMRARAVEYALLATTLFRTAGIPSRIITGVYIDDLPRRAPRAVTHYWNEFFLPGFGWVGIDSAMGDGLYQGAANAGQDAEQAAAARTFYFGNLDNERIALSNDIFVVPQYNNDSQLHSFDRSYLLFTHQIETTKPIDDDAFYLYAVAAIQ